MKRYYIFGWDKDVDYEMNGLFTYKGGMNDCLFQCNDLEKNKWKIDVLRRAYEYFYIWDVQNNTCLNQ